MDSKRKTVMPSSHRPDATKLPTVKWIRDASRLSPTENVETERVQNSLIIDVKTLTCK